jgi:ketosteroid isomerase-like protein
MGDVEELERLNEQFIDAFRIGSWERLRPVLADDFAYLDGDTGERWSEEQYIADLDGHAIPDIAFDQVQIHVAGDTAVVSARTARANSPGVHRRYVDTYERRGDGWLCVHACVWLLSGDGD